MTSHQGPLTQACHRCHRQGFTWARGYCQYCGHRQFDDDIFADERNEKEQINAEAVEEYREAHRKNRPSNDDSGVDNSLFDSCAGDGWDGGGD